LALYEAKNGGRNAVVMYRGQADDLLAATSLPPPTPPFPESLPTPSTPFIVNMSAPNIRRVSEVARPEGSDESDGKPDR
jgi:hypothetical protein